MSGLVSSARCVFSSPPDANQLNNHWIQKVIYLLNIFWIQKGDLSAEYHSFESLESPLITLTADDTLYYFPLLALEKS